MAGCGQQLTKSMWIMISLGFLFLIADISASNGFLFQRIPNYKLTTPDLMPSFSDSNPGRCTQACLSSDMTGQTCALVNFNSVTKECQIYLGDTSPLDAVGNSFEANSDWSIFHKNNLLDKYWTRPYNNDVQSDAQDDESLETTISNGNNVCRGLDPLWAKCSTGSTTFNHRTFASTALDDILKPGQDCTPSGGLVCLDSDQTSGTCSDYSVSFQCITTIKNYDESLIGYWTFDSNLDDQSGNAYHGDAVNSATTTDTTYVKGGGSLQLTPDGAYVKVNSLKNYNWGNALSVSVWFRRVGADGHYSTILGNGWWTDGSFDLRCHGSAICGSTIMTSADSGNGWEFTGTSSFDTWHHAVLIYDGTTPMTSFYIDGVKISGLSTRDSGNIVTANLPLYFGYNTYSSPPETFRGYIDEVRIYSRVLDDQDIGWLFSQGENKV